MTNSKQKIGLMILVLCSLSTIGVSSALAPYNVEVGDFFVWYTKLEIESTNPDIPDVTVEYYEKIEITNLTGEFPGCIYETYSFTTENSSISYGSARLVSLFYSIPTIAYYSELYNETTVEYAENSYDAYISNYNIDIAAAITALDIFDKISGVRLEYTLSKNGVAYQSTILVSTKDVNLTTFDMDAGIAAFPFVVFSVFSLAAILVISRRKPS